MKLTDTFTASILGAVDARINKINVIRTRARQAYKARSRRTVDIRLLQSMDDVEQLYKALNNPADAEEYFGVPRDNFEIPRQKQPEDTSVAADIGNRSKSFPTLAREQFRKAVAAQRQSDFKQRLHHALADAELDRKPAVFATFTCNEQWERDFRDNNGRIWSEWQRKLKRALPGMECACVAELGSLTGRLHLHAVITAGTWPAHSLADPKRHNRDYHREIQAPIEWPYGFAQWLPIRYNTADAWSRFHNWPNERLEGGTVKPIQTGNAAKVAAYVAKYITKGGNLPWRTRITRKLGTRRQQEWLSQHHKLATHLPRATCRALKLSKALIMRLTAQPLVKSWKDADLIAGASHQTLTASAWDYVRMVNTIHVSTSTRPNTTLCPSHAEEGFNLIRQIAAKLETDQVNIILEAIHSDDPQLYYQLREEHTA